MQQSFVDRVARIVSGGFHALVGAVEDRAPELVMEQAIREVDGVIDEARAGLGQVITKKHHANQQLTKCGKEHAELEAKAEQAVTAGRDDLATAAIVRMTELEAQIAVMQETIAGADAEEADYNKYIEALKGKKHEMQQDLARYRAQQRSSAPAGVVAGAGGVIESVRVEKATDAFDQTFQRATGVDPATSGMDRANAAALAELESLSKAKQVEDRLVQLKAKLKP